MDCGSPLPLFLPRSLLRGSGVMVRRRPSGIAKPQRPRRAAEFESVKALCVPPRSPWLCGSRDSAVAVRICHSSSGPYPASRLALLKAAAGCRSPRRLRRSLAAGRGDHRVWWHNFSRRSRTRRTTREVHPVWWEAPRPSPVSAWKYSWKRSRSCQWGTSV